MTKKKKSDIDEMQIDETIREQPEDTQAAETAPTVNEEDKDWKDQAMRIMAEFDNYKKRTAKEREQLYKDITADAVANILPVLDNFQRATAIEVVGDEAKGVMEGVAALERQLSDILTQMGVEVIESVGKEFNPEYHNAVMHIEDENLGNNIVAEEFAKGYLYKDKVIRHSMVKVAN